MTPSSSIDFTKGIILETAKAFNNAELHDVRLFWLILLSMLKAHWIAIVITLVILFVVSILLALMGRWRMFGSLLYNFLYFGTLLLVGLIFGPDIFSNNYFDIFTFMLYITCFILVGISLNKMGFRKHRKY